MLYIIVIIINLIIKRGNKISKKKSKKQIEQEAHDKEIKRLVEKGIITPFSIPDNMPNIDLTFEEEEIEIEIDISDFLRNKVVDAVVKPENKKKVNKK